MKGLGWLITVTVAAYIILFYRSGAPDSEPAPPPPEERDIDWIVTLNCAVRTDSSNAHECRPVFVNSENKFYSWNFKDTDIDPPVLSQHTPGMRYRVVGHLMPVKDPLYRLEGEIFVHEFSREK